MHPNEPANKAVFTDGHITQEDRPGKHTRASLRENKGTPAAWLGDEQALAAVTITTDIVKLSERIRACDVRIPQSCKQAMESVYADRWKAAMATQIKDIERMKGYILVNKPAKSEDIKILPGKWVFALKQMKDNFIEKFKARWVVYGNNQRPGIDFINSSAPVFERLIRHLSNLNNRPSDVLRCALRISQALEQSP